MRYESSCQLTPSTSAPTYQSYHWPTWLLLKAWPFQLVWPGCQRGNGDPAWAAASYAQNELRLSSSGKRVSTRPPEPTRTAQKLLSPRSALTRARYCFAFRRSVAFQVRLATL